MRFLIDTNICVHAMHRKPGVIRAILSHRRPDMAISVVTEAELMFGTSKSATPAKARKKLDAFLAAFEILDFTSSEAEVYGALRTKLERAGTPIGPLDMLIAAHAKALDLVLVTANEREFRRVPGLRVENWATA
jgi:tRNA(fMet)-specific endonuclease VapC